MKLVVLESPYSNSNGRTIEQNKTYARECMRDCILKGEAPIASHLLYTQKGILKDEIPEERALGIQCGFEWNKYAEKTVVYTDYGISMGMIEGIRDADAKGRLVVFRKLGEYVRSK